MSNCPGAVLNMKCESSALNADSVLKMVLGVLKIHCESRGAHSRITLAAGCEVCESLAVWQRDVVYTSAGNLRPVLGAISPRFAPPHVRFESVSFKMNPFLLWHKSHLMENYYCIIALSPT